MDEQQNILNNIFISWKVCKENHTLSIISVIPF